MADYLKYKAQFTTSLQDHGVIPIAAKDFRLKMAGAMYYLNNNEKDAITVQSYQLSQTDKTSVQDSY